MIALLEQLLTGDAPDLWEATKKDIFYLYVSSVVYIIAVLVYDFKTAYPALDKKLLDRLHGGESEAEQLDLDEDVRREADRVAAGGAAGEACVLHQLRKQYPGGKVAVRNVR